MAEQKTAEQQMREQFQVAETMYQNSVKVLNDVTTVASEFGFDMAEKNLRYAMDLQTQAERNVQDAMKTYRSIYFDGLKTWQGYVQGMGEMLTRDR
jgi:hypothetical protein